MRIAAYFFLWEITVAMFDSLSNGPSFLQMVLPSAQSDLSFATALASLASARGRLDLLQIDHPSGYRNTLTTPFISIPLRKCTRARLTRIATPEYTIPRRYNCTAPVGGIIP